MKNQKLQKKQQLLIAAIVEKNMQYAVVQLFAIFVENANRKIILKRCAKEMLIKTNIKTEM